MDRAAHDDCMTPTREEYQDRHPRADLIFKLR